MLLVAMFSTMAVTVSALEMYVGTMYSDASCTSNVTYLYWTPTTQNCSWGGPWFADAYNLMVVSGNQLYYPHYQGLACNSAQPAFSQTVTLGQCTVDSGTGRGVLFQQVSVQDVVRRDLFTSTGCPSPSNAQRDYWPIGTCTPFPFAAGVAARSAWISVIDSTTLNLTSYLDLACTVPTASYLLSSGTCAATSALVGNEHAVMFTYLPQPTSNNDNTNTGTGANGNGSGGLSGATTGASSTGGTGSTGNTTSTSTGRTSVATSALPSFVSILCVIVVALFSPRS